MNMFTNVWYLFLIGGLSFTWAEDYNTTAAAVSDRVTDGKFKETTIFTDFNETLNGNSPISQDKLTESTEGTRNPKIDEEEEDDDDEFIDLDDDEALLIAFHKQLKNLPPRRPVGPKRICGKRITRNARIVGGGQTFEGEFPWAVSVRLLTTHNCGGTIITKDWILTAAHCVKRYTPRYFRVRPGDSGVGTRGFRYDLDIHVAEMIIHPKFGKPRRYSNDLALLRLKKPLKMDHLAQPICLPDPNVDYSGRNATAVGWGATKEEARGEYEDRPNKLQKVIVPILNNSMCADWYADVYQGYVQIYDYQICAGFKEGGKDACQGDSGGPLVTKEGDHYTLVGIVSAGVGCARKQLPGLYSRISLFVPWIQNVTGVAYN